MKGDFILSGKNFGCGSSREHAPIALSHCGVKAILALSFCKNFLIEILLMVHFCYLLKLVKMHMMEFLKVMKLILMFSKNEIKNITKNQTYKMKPFSEIIGKIIAAGGLFKYKPDQD